MKEFDHEFAEHIYYTASAFEKKGGLWPVRAGRNEAKPGYSVGPKIIECYSIHFVLEGAVDFEYKAGSATLSSGDLFCLYPHHKYLYRRAISADKQAPLRLYWLAFNGAQAPYLLDRLGISREKPYLRDRLTPDTEAALRETLALMQGAGDDYRLSAAMYRVFGHLRDARERDRAEPGEEHWIATAINHMQTHYMEGITVADVVRVAGVHRSHLYSAMARETGMGPQQYLTKLRMERAVEMLKTRAYSVTEVALSLGYPDLYSFTRAFGNYFGTPPSRYPIDQTK